MTLSDTQRLVLSRASRHKVRLTAALTGLPAAARDAVFRAMLRNGLLAEVAAPREHAGLAWREDEASARVALRVTDAGLRAIGGDPHEGTEAAPAAVPVAAEPAPNDIPAAEAAQVAPAGAGEAARVGGLALLDKAPAAPTPRAGALRLAAQAVLDTWDDADRGALAGPMERLRAVLAKPARAARETGAPRKPREGTKAAVLALLRRPERASGPQLVGATGWAPQTVRGFLAGLARKGIAVTVLERVRQVGPNKAGAKGSYSICRIAEAG